MKWWVKGKDFERVEWKINLEYLYTEKFSDREKILCREVWVLLVNKDAVSFNSADSI